MRYLSKEESKIEELKLPPGFKFGDCIVNKCTSEEWKIVGIYPNDPPRYKLIIERADGHCGFINIGTLKRLFLLK